MRFLNCKTYHSVKMRNFPNRFFLCIKLILVQRQRQIYQKRGRQSEGNAASESFSVVQLYGIYMPRVRCKFMILFLLAGKV